MKRLTTLFGILALACSANVANADILNLPDADTFNNIVFFDFPFNISSINSVSLDLEIADPSTSQIVMAGPGGSNFILMLFPDAPINGSYTFVESGQPFTMGPGSTDTTAGTFNAVSWTDPLILPDGTGWNINFVGPEAGSFSNISIDYTSAVPEPGSALIMLGVAGMAVVRRRR